MKTQVHLQKIGIGIHLPSIGNGFNFTDTSMDRFIEKLWEATKYFELHGCTLVQIEGINICGVIGLTFDVDRFDCDAFKEMVRGIQMLANVTLKGHKK